MRLAARLQKNLRTTRLRRKPTQGERARRAALSVSYVSMLERGQRSPPLDTLEGLARALGVPAVKLLR